MEVAPVGVVVCGHAAEDGVVGWGARLHRIPNLRPRQSPPLPSDMLLETLVFYFDNFFKFLCFGGRGFGFLRAG